MWPKAVYICQWDAGRCCRETTCFQTAEGAWDACDDLPCCKLKVPRQCWDDLLISLCPLCAGGMFLQLLISGGGSNGLTQAVWSFVLPCSASRRHDPKVSSYTYKLWGLSETDACCWREPFQAKGAWSVGLAQKNFSCWLWASFLLWSWPALQHGQHLAAGLKGGYHAGIPGTARWTHECFEGRRT